MTKKILNFELPVPTKRECRICSTEYVGTRIICDSDSCWNEFQYQRESKRFKYGPVYVPRTSFVFEELTIKDEE